MLPDLSVIPTQCEKKMAIARRMETLPAAMRWTMMLRKQLTSCSFHSDWMSFATLQNIWTYHIDLIL
jgi:hypothetical protein